MKSIKQIGGAMAIALGVTTAFAAETRLTWSGGSSGDWNAAKAWTDEQGEAVDWTDGAVAVLTGENGMTVSIPEGVTIAADGIGCEPAAKSAVIYVKGKGVLRIGGGGDCLTGHLDSAEHPECGRTGTCRRPDVDGCQDDNPLP